MPFYKEIFLAVLILFLFQVNCWAQLPPSLSAGDKQPYCPLTQIEIAPSFNIVNVDNEPIDKIYIQISEGYVRGEDKLELIGAHSNITAKAFNTIEGKLELKWNDTSGTPNDDELISAVKKVVFESSSATAFGNRTFSITIGTANYLPSTGHYYEYIPNDGITWSKAKDDAEKNTFYGISGYLATLTSLEEAQLCGEQAAGAGWIGASDKENETVWRWVTGPESLEDGGLGRKFWQGNGSGSGGRTTIPDNYANWNGTTEPNNSGDEDYAHIVTDTSVGDLGTWNDLSNTGHQTDISDPYYPRGYIVEYGGMPGDPSLNISASSKIYIPEITSTTPNAICGEGSITISATSSSGDVLWFDEETGGTQIDSGFNLIRTLTNTTTFYALASENGCTEGIRVPVLAEVKTIPTITSSTNKIICGMGDAIISATPSAGIVNWYDAPTGGNLIDTGNSITLTAIDVNTTLYAEAFDNDCSSISRTPVTATVQYTTEPTATTTQTFCDVDNATLADLAITGTDIKWYADVTGGIHLGSTKLLLNNTTYYASQTVNTCESPNRLPITTLVYATVKPLPPSENLILEECDSKTSGSDTDGFTNFNLTSSESSLINGENLSNFTFSYFTDPSYSAISKINNPENFENTVINGQSVYARISNNIDAICFTDVSFKIQVNKLPEIESSITLVNCDEDGNPDGYTDFNLTTADIFVTKGDSALTVDYFISLADAEAGAPILNPSPFNNSSASTVFARVKNTFGCNRIATVELKVSVTILPPGFNYEITNCDNDETIDGLTTFDLTEAADYFLTILPPQNLSIHFYKNLVDAQLKENEIIPQNAYKNAIPFSEELYVRVESIDNGDCFGIGQHLNLKVNPRTEFSIPTAEILCLNVGVKTITATSSISGLTYEWFDENGTSIETTNSIDIIAPGNYTAIATSIEGCKSFPQTVVISASDIATISLEDVSITDDSENNTITINTTNLGIGEYEYALDDQNYQSKHVFENVEAGIHTIFIQDKRGCGIASIEVSVIGYPKFFSPNGDDFNPYWQVLGVNDDFYPSSKIYIFDRFGKLITQINPTSKGWDGTFNGEVLPSTDYWFTAQLIDKNGNIREKKGHFSLIR